MGDLKARYEEDGYLVMKNAIPVAVLQEFKSFLGEWLSREKAAPKNLRFRFKNLSPTGELALDAIDPVLDLFPKLRAIAENETLIGTLQIIHDEKVRLFKDKLILKSAGAEGYPLHQDYIAWRDFPRSFTTAVIPLDDARLENGCIEVFPGVHRLGALSRPDGEFHDLSELTMGGVKPVALELNVGDVGLFGGFVPHRSSSNRSTGPRRQLYFSYNRESEIGDYRDRHYEIYRKWLMKRYEQFGAQGFFFD